jgi:hypothetical protein
MQNSDPWSPQIRNLRDLQIEYFVHCKQRRPIVGIAKVVHQPVCLCKHARNVAKQSIAAESVKFCTGKLIKTNTAMHDNDEGCLLIYNTCRSTEVRACNISGKEMAK